jgi:hypothetical protein
MMLELTYPFHVHEARNRTASICKAILARAPILSHRVAVEVLRRVLPLLFHHSSKPFSSLEPGNMLEHYFREVQLCSLLSENEQNISRFVRVRLRSDGDPLSQSTPTG